MRDADADAPSSQEPSLDELLMSAARALRRTWSRGLGPDLSPHDARALRVIGRHGPTRLGEVADHLRIAPRSATDVVDRLEARGLVERAPDPADRRAMTVSLTTVGAACWVTSTRRGGKAPRSSSGASLSTSELLSRRLSSSSTRERTDSPCPSTLSRRCSTP